MEITMFTNQTGIPVALAVWLATDNYDHNIDPMTISATSLLKPVRQIILSSRIQSQSKIDIASLLASRMGTAIHDSIEKAWIENYESAFKSLGYPDRAISRIRINPELSDLGEDDIPIYLEKRSERKIDGFTITGKFDFVIEGRVEDFKSTGTYTYMTKSKDQDYILQASIYRWLNPEIITADDMRIHFIFTDWKALDAKLQKDKGYPQSKTLEYPLRLMSLQETEHWIKRKLQEIQKYWSSDDLDIPFCTDEQLWRTPPVFKYYKDPNKRTRSTKNFDNAAEAYLRLTQEGGKGIVVEAGGEVKACRYCSAFEICKQKDMYLADGSLII